MARTEAGNFARGAATGAVDSAAITWTTTSNLLVVHLGWSDGSLNVGDITVQFGDGTNWEALTQLGGNEGGFNNEGNSWIFYRQSPTTTYDTIRITLTPGPAYGLIATWMFYENADLTQGGGTGFVDWGAGNTNNTSPWQDTMAGGTTGDDIFVSGMDYTGVGANEVIITNQSQTEIAAAAGGTNFIFARMGEKSWADGTTIAVASATDPYLIGAAWVIREAGADTSPTLTNVQTTSVTNDGFTVQATTNAPNGTMYQGVYTSTATTASDIQLRNGLDGDNNALTNFQKLPVTTTGQKTFSPVTGLGSGTSWKISVCHAGDAG